MNVGVQFEILVDGKVLRCLEGCCDCLGRATIPLARWRVGTGRPAKSRRLATHLASSNVANDASDRPWL